MADLLITEESHDLVVLDDLIIIPIVEDSTAQRLKIRLLTFKGEWFLNTNFGIPYYQVVFQKRVTKGQVDSIFRVEILSTPDVETIVNFDSIFNNATREYTLTFSCIVTSGEIVTLTI